MEIVKVDLTKNAYDICISTGMQCFEERLKLLTEGRKLLVISDSTVFPLHGEIVIDVLKRFGSSVSRYIMRAGETSKQIDEVSRIYDFMLEENLGREDLVVALGGGVVGDVAGFAASTYCRGIPFIQMPTTLLSQVDSSVGGKVGINFQHVKNIIGSFYQPKMVCINLEFLKTLPQRQIRNGLAEIVVHAIIANESLFTYLEQNIDKVFHFEFKTLEYLVGLNCSIKRDVVVQDEYDKGIRGILNFGHTIGHAVEASSNYQLLHGEAVSIGIMGAIKLAKYLSMLTEETYNRIENLLKKIGLPLKVHGVRAEDIYGKMLNDKKRKASHLRFVLPNKIGNVEIVEFNDKKVMMEIIGTLID